MLVPTHADIVAAGYDLTTSYLAGSLDPASWDGFVLVLPSEPLTSEMEVYHGYEPNGGWKTALVSDNYNRSVPEMWGLVRKRCQACAMNPAICPICPLKRDLNFVARLAKRAGYRIETLSDLPSSWSEDYSILRPNQRTLWGDEYWLPGTGSDRWTRTTSNEGQNIDGSHLFRRPRRPFDVGETLALIKSAGYTTDPPHDVIRPKTWDNAFDIVLVGEPRTLDLEFWDGSRAWGELTSSATSDPIQPTWSVFRRRRIEV